MIIRWEGYGMLEDEPVEFLVPEVIHAKRALKGLRKMVNI